MSRTFAPAKLALRRVFTRQGRAEGNLRCQVEKVQRALSSSNPPNPSSVVTALASLGAAQHEWEQVRSAGGNAGPGPEGWVAQILDERKSPAFVHSLARDLQAEQTQQLIERLRDEAPAAARQLERLRAAVLQVVIRSARSLTLACLDEVLRKLARNVAPTTLALELRKLAQALQRWGKLDPHARSDLYDLMKQTLDEHWPHDQSLQLARAIASDRARRAQELLQGPDGTPEWVLVQLQAAIHEVSFERVLRTIDDSLMDAVETIRTEQLTQLVEQRTEQALRVAVTGVGLLRKHGVLKQLNVDPDPPETYDQRSREQKLSQALEVFDSRLESCGLTDTEVRELVRHLEGPSLNMAQLATGSSRLRAAADAEILARTEQLRARAQSIAAGGGPIHRDGSVDSVQLASLTKLVEGMVGHSTVSGHASKQLGQTLEEVAPVVSQASRTLSAALERLREEAKLSIRHVGDILVAVNAGNASHQISLLLPACRLMMAAVERYLSARQPLGGVSQKQNFALGFKVLLRDMIADLQREGGHEGRPFAIHVAFGNGEMRALLSALQRAVRRASEQQLPQLHQDLEHLQQAFECMREVARLRSHVETHSLSLIPKLDLLDEEARDALKRTYSIAIEPATHAMLPRSRISLTAGKCPPQFTEQMRQAIEEPFRQTELEYATLSGGTRVPAQFLADAERDGTVWLGHDGLPLIDRSQWSELSVEQRHERIEAGYTRLLQYYGNNKTQTDAILRNASQSLTSAFQTATRLASDSPILFEEVGPGMVSGVGLNGDHQTVFMFKVGANRRPCLQMHYEARGGYIVPQNFTPENANDGGTTYLDLERSWAGVTLDVELNEGGAGLVLLDTPTYDVHLAKNWAQCPYPPPRREHLLSHDPANQALYRDLISYAGKHHPELHGALAAMYELTRMEPVSSDGRALGLALGKLYQAHLHPRATDLLPQLRPDSPHAASAARALLEFMQGLEQQETAPFFEAAEREARARLQQLASRYDLPLPQSGAHGNDAGSEAAIELPEEWRTRLSDAEAAAARRLLEFLEAIERWQGAPAGKAIEALRLCERFIVRQPLFGSEIAAGVHAELAPLLGRIKAAMPLIDRLLEELGEQIPEELFGGFARYLPDEIARVRQIDQQVDRRQRQQQEEARQARETASERMSGSPRPLQRPESS